jgi:hypothetical protein
MVSMAELNAAERRVLILLAGGRRTVVEIAAQGIKGDVLSGLVKAGLARKVVEKVGRGVLTTEITRGWEITPAGRKALGGEHDTSILRRAKACPRD